ncbi:MAG: PilN domain-containing protein [Pseudomonadales bacterium]|jgi:type IV pilus assembly protein PilN
MNGINLLPWREWERDRLRREFFTQLAATVLGAIAVVLIAGLVLDYRVDAQNARNRFLREEISALDRQIIEIANLRKTRGELLARIQVILELQANRPTVVRVFDELVRTLPSGLHFNTLSMTGTTLALTAEAEANNRIATLMRNLDGSNLFTEPTLKSIQEDPENAHYGSAASAFNLTFVQTPPHPVSGTDELTRPQAAGAATPRQRNEQGD